MRPPPLPYTLEDRTGHALSSDFDDIYDRLFLKLSYQSTITPIADNHHHLHFYSHQQQQRQDTVLIHNMTWRSSPHRDTLSVPPGDPDPAVVMQFGPGKTLGSITFQTKSRRVSFTMAGYLKKASMFSGSLQRKFVASDGREYKWGYQTVQGQEWSCTSEENYLVAHYDLKPHDMRAYGTSGNVFTIYEPFQSIATELLGTLTVMRYIAQNNL
jgi:hypothetical protein